MYVARRRPPNPAKFPLSVPQYMAWMALGIFVGHSQPYDRRQATPVGLKAEVQRWSRDQKRWISGRCEPTSSGRAVITDRGTPYGFLAQGGRVQVCSSGTSCSTVRQTLLSSHAWCFSVPSICSAPMGGCHPMLAVSIRCRRYRIDTGRFLKWLCAMFSLSTHGDDAD